MWAQVIVATLALIVTSIGAWSIFEIRKQTELQKKRMETDAYRPLISERFQSIKRFLSSDKVQEHMERLEDKLNKQVNNERNEYKKLLEETRCEFQDLAADIKLPMLGRDASLDDVEALINEYNYLSKLIEDEALDVDFATELGKSNFKHIYQLVTPLIKLRRKLSTNYASHFSNYIRDMDE